jgi:predicted ribosome quality control (RQC) complex YloA/Tae2 family protein
MKKQLSSLDLHFLLKELEILKNSRIDKIHQPEKNLLIFKFYKTNIGKKLLRIDIGQSLFLTEEKEFSGETLGFGMLLRKHLDGYFLVDIEQLKPERILKLTFKTKEETKYLYLEFFGKGNAILCNEHDVILNASEHHEFRERVVKPKLKYVYPIMSYNLFDINKKQLEELLKSSKKDIIVTSLAVELGLGGLYSEEICLLSNIDKNQNPKNINEMQIQSILNSIKEIINKKIDANIVFESTNVVDFAPFPLKFYQGKDFKKFSTFNETIQYFYSQFKEVKETEYDKKLRNLQRIIEEQKQTIEKLKEEEKELREKGELIYHKYTLVKEILEEINKASKKHSWKEIKEKLKGHKIVKEVNEKERNRVVEI